MRGCPRPDRSCSSVASLLAGCVSSLPPVSHSVESPLMSRIRILSSLVALALVPAVRAQQFTYDAAALPAQNLWTDGVALVDVDGDTDLDILFANGGVYGGTGSQGALAQHLFLNDGTGHFTAAH